MFDHVCTAKDYGGEDLREAFIDWFAGNYLNKVHMVSLMHIK